MKLLLFADHGKGPRVVTGRVFWTIEHGIYRETLAQRMQRLRARRWWLVNCATAAEGRRFIAELQAASGVSGVREGRLGVGHARIFASGGASQ